LKEKYEFLLMAKNCLFSYNYFKFIVKPYGYKR